MRNNLGVTALEIINPNLRIREWLHGLAASDIIGQDAVTDASEHFKVQRDRADWELFLRRIFALIGSLLAVSGLIFFMAWNWESMSRFAKFAVLEVSFALFAAYSLLRWKSGPQKEAGWDARIALLGAGILAGGLMALYGQVYQTGADPWELFRAWTILLVFIALAGQSTVFWFVAWVVGNLWFLLFMRLHPVDLFKGESIFLLSALLQFILLAVVELASRLSARYGGHFDSERWLARIIGCTGLIVMACFAMSAAFASTRYYANPSPLDDSGGTLIYLLSLGIIGFVYYRLIPELSFLALSIFSLTSYLVCIFLNSIIGDLFMNGMDVLLIFGLVIIGAAFGALKLVLIVRKHLQQKILSGATGSSYSATLLRGRTKKAELVEWLLKAGKADQESLDGYFKELEAQENAKWPWYARLFVTLGVWIGSLAIFGFLSLVLFESLFDGPVVLGVIGFIFCGISLYTGSSSSIALRAFSQVIGLCGLAYSIGFVDFSFRPSVGLLAALLAVFWLFKPPYAGRVLAFVGTLICIFLFMDVPSLSYQYLYYGLERQPLFYTNLKIVICCLGLLWAAHYFVVMKSRLIYISSYLESKNSQWRFNPREAVGASALACLLFFAGLALYQQLYNSRLVFLFIYLDFHLAIPLTFLILTGLLAWRYPAARSLCVPFGLALAVAGWFAPALALGLALLFLAYYSGHLGFLSLAVIYMVAGNIIYYYNLDISLLHKSLVLMVVGVCFLAISAGMKLFSARSSATGASI